MTTRGAVLACDKVAIGCFVLGKAQVKVLTRPGFHV